MRLLLNLVEVVFARRADVRSAEAHRQLLAGILYAFTSKLSSLHHRLPLLLSYGAVPKHPNCPCAEGLVAVFEKTPDKSDMTLEKCAEPKN